MKHIKLNKNWSAEPTASEPKFVETESSFNLTFFLNHALFEHIDNGDLGTLEFIDVHQYCSSIVNRDEYVKGNYRFKNQQLAWGDFYEILDGSWKNSFPENRIVVNSNAIKKKLRHFVIFFAEQIVECIALDFQFKFNDTISEKLEEKYPKGYFDHFLAMFASLFDKPSSDNYLIYCDLYMQMESKKEFIAMKKEISEIKRNIHLPAYLKIANYYGIENFGMQQLDEMLQTIETYRVD